MLLAQILKCEKNSFDFFFKIGFHCNSSGCPVTHSVDKAALELTEICLPLDHECWELKECATSPSSKYKDVLVESVYLFLPCRYSAALPV